MSEKRRKPTLAELERILEGGETGSVEILPSGEIVIGPSEVERLRAALRDARQRVQELEHVSPEQAVEAIARALGDGFRKAGVTTTDAAREIIARSEKQAEALAAAAERESRVSQLLERFYNILAGDTRFKKGHPSLLRETLAVLSPTPTEPQK